eukprot:g17761.t1
MDEHLQNALSPVLQELAEKDADFGLALQCSRKVYGQDINGLRRVVTSVEQQRKAAGEKVPAVLRQEDKDLPAAVSMLVRSAALTGRVWLDVHLEDVSRLGAPTSAQLLVDLRRIVDTITETRSDHSGVTSSKIVLDPQKLPPAEDLLRWPWSHRWQMFRSIVEHHLLDTTKGEGEQATPVETAVFEAFEARKSDDQVPDWAHGAFAAMVLEYVASLNRRPEPTMLREHEFDSLAATIALSCEISLPGAPLAKASPQLQEKLAHVKMIMSQVITTHFHANAEVRMPTRGIAVSTYFQASAHLLMDIARLLQLDADFGQGAMVRVPQCRPWAFGGEEFGATDSSKVC